MFYTIREHRKDDLTSSKWSTTKIYFYLLHDS